MLNRYMLLTLIVALLALVSTVDSNPMYFFPAAAPTYPIRGDRYYRPYNDNYRNRPSYGDGAGAGYGHESYGGSGAGPAPGYGQYPGGGSGAVPGPVYGDDSYGGGSYGIQPVALGVHG